jgi:hypothetical protein
MVNNHELVSRGFCALLGVCAIYRPEHALLNNLNQCYRMLKSIKRMEIC